MNVVLNINGLNHSSGKTERYTKPHYIGQNMVPQKYRKSFSSPLATVGAYGMDENVLTYVNPTELSYWNYDNVINFDPYFSRFDPSFRISSPINRIRIKRNQTVVKNPDPSKRQKKATEGLDLWSFRFSSNLLSLDRLDMYIDFSCDYRGGRKFNFKSKLLADILTRELELSQWEDSGIDHPRYFKRVNDVFRFNRFSPGDDNFHQHFDIPYWDRENEEESRYTLLLYLQFRPDVDLISINTSQGKLTLRNLSGLIMHHGLEHEGIASDKVFLRTELIFNMDSDLHIRNVTPPFTMACYSQIHQLGDSRYITDMFNRSVKLRFLTRGEDPPVNDPLGLDPSAIYYRKQLGSVGFITNGYQYLFTKGQTLGRIAIIVLHDFLNLRPKVGRLRQSFRVNRIGYGTDMLETLCNGNGESTSGESPCPICSLSKPMILAFDCIHGFCFRCIKTWFRKCQQMPTCPLCRKEVKSDPPGDSQIGDLLFQSIGGADSDSDTFGVSSTDGGERTESDNDGESDSTSRSTSASTLNEPVHPPIGPGHESGPGRESGQGRESGPGHESGPDSGRESVGSDDRRSVCCAYHHSEAEYKRYCQRGDFRMPIVEQFYVGRNRRGQIKIFGKESDVHITENKIFFGVPKFNYAACWNTCSKSCYTGVKRWYGKLDGHSYMVYQTLEKGYLISMELFNKDYDKRIYARETVVNHVCGGTGAWAPTET